MGYEVKNLRVYTEAHKLLKMCYERYSDSKEFWLKDQILRSAGSIGANIAEMCGYESSSMKYHKCSIALGEANEVMFWLETLKENDKDIIEQVHVVQKMLFSLRNKFSVSDKRLAGGD